MTMMISKFNKIIASKIFWIFFSLLMCVAMVLFIPGVDPAEVLTGGSDGGKTLAKVAGKSVSQDDLADARSQVRFSNEFINNRRVNEDLVDESAWQRIAFLGEAEKMGIRVTDEEVENQFRQHISRLAQGQPYSDQLRANVVGYVQREYGMNEADLKEAFRDEVSISDLEGRFVDSVVVPEYDLRREYEGANDNYKVEYVTFSNTVDSANVPVTPEQIQAYYDDNQPQVDEDNNLLINAQYGFPLGSTEFYQREQVKVKGVVFDYANYIDADAIDSNEVLGAYEINYTNYFRDVEIPNPAYALDTNNLPTIKSVELIPFEEVEGQIRTNLALAGDAPQKAEAEANALSAALGGRHPDANFDEITATFTNGVVFQTDYFTGTNKLEDVVDESALRGFIQASFKLSDDQWEKVTDPIVGSNKVYVAYFDGKKAPYIKTLEEARDTAIAGARRVEAVEVFEGQMESIKDKIAASVATSGSFSNAAKTLGYAFKAPQAFSPAKGQVPGIANFNGLAQAVTGYNQGEFLEPLAYNDGETPMGMVAQLVSRNAPSQSNLAEERQTLSDRLAREFVFPIGPNWLTSVQEKNGVSDFIKSADEEEDEDSDEDSETSETKEPSDDTSTTSTASTPDPVTPPTPAVVEKPAPVTPPTPKPPAVVTPAVVAPAVTNPGIVSTPKPPVVPTPANPAVVKTPKPATPAVPAVPTPAKPAVVKTPEPVTPAVPAVPTPAKPAVVKTPEPVTPAVPAVPTPAKPAVVKTPKPVTPAVPAVPTPAKPAVVKTPKPVTPAVSAVPTPAKPAVVKTPKPVTPAVPAVPTPAKPAVVKTPEPMTPPAVVPATPVAPATPAVTENGYFSMINKGNNRFILGQRSSFMELARDNSLANVRTFLGAGPTGENLVFEADPANQAFVNRLVDTYNTRMGTTLNLANAKSQIPGAEKSVPTSPATPAVVPTPVPAPAPTSVPAIDPAATSSTTTSLPASSPVAQANAFIASRPVDKTVANWRTSLAKFPDLTFPADTELFWNLDTNKGKIRVKFMPEVAPNHVANFVYLTQLGFFDGLKFHRVIPGFMAQGGCPLGQGSGGPGYKFGGEYDAAVRHTEGGLLSMANAGEGTDGSQFFLTFKATPWLDGKHTIFGKTVEGLDTLKRMEAAGSQSGRTSELLKINSATISTATK